MPVAFDFELIYFPIEPWKRPHRAAKLLLVYLSYAYTCDVVKHYSYFHIKIKINKNLSPPIPSFADLGIKDIASFCFCNLLSLHGSKSNVTCVYV